jgi:hypothetical protein
MDELTALHTAARRYCQDRFAEWAGIYQDLQRKEGAGVQNLFQPGWDYSDEAYRTFPRYRFAKNTQIEIERLVVDSKTSLSEIKARLIAASEKAHTNLHTKLTNKLARQALREEAEDFKAHVEAVNPADLAQVEPLPYRRVLSKEETERLWGELKKVWGVGGGYWYPLKEGPMPPDSLVFHTDYFQSINGEALLREALQRRGISRVLLLHEFGDPEYEIELGIFEPGYKDGGEQYSTSEQVSWMVNASHESSITVCGQWLTDFFRKLRPECAERTYNGPYSTPDLRGTWDTDR